MEHKLGLVVAALPILLVACGDDGMHADAGLDTGAVCSGACGEVGGLSEAGPEAGSACYSPGTDLSLVLQSGAVGCACTSADHDVCVGGMGYICMGGQWKAVVDGPCFPIDPPGRDAGAADLPLEARVGTDATGDQTTVDTAERQDQAGIDTASACYRPGADLSLVFQTGAVGCACTSADRDVCAGGMGYLCMGGQWKAVLDGPCFPIDPPWRDAAAANVPLDGRVAGDAAGEQAPVDGG